jgi:uncharacterized repeat protein (TIGR01451 family)
MGLTMANASLENWVENTTFTKVTNHRLVTHIPSGTLTWRMPLYSEEVPLGVTGAHALHGKHLVWQVTASGAEVIANGGAGPLLATRAYGRGRFIYYGARQPLIGHGGSDAGMYAYVIFRRAIEWAFEAADLPIIKLSPWRYPYDAAFVVRHDMENTPWRIQSIEASAQAEAELGAKGDYYFCTGVVRIGSEDHQLTDPQKQAAIQSLQRAVSLYGATIGSHNGGLPNPGNPTLPPSTYDYWHWGPDEALDTSPPGYPDGSAYAQTSIATSFQDIEGWLAGLDNGRPGCGAAGNCPRNWVSPYFNSARDGSYDILAQLGAITMGEQKISPFPHWTVSYEGSERHPHVTLPTSEWYIGTDLAHSLETGHTVASVHALVDLYYGLGALINLYGHSPSSSGVAWEYVSYSAAKPHIWSTNAVGVYDWWVLRSGVAVTPGYSQVGSTAVAVASISGASDPETAIEVVIPGWDGGANTVLEISLDGVPADAADFRTTDYGVKVKVGAGTTNVEVRYGPPADLQVTQSDSPDPVSVGSPLVYTLSVANHGPSEATGVTLVDHLPAQATLGPIVTSQGDCSGTNPITCHLDTLSASSAATITVVITPTVAGTITNTVSVTQTEIDPNNADNTAGEGTEVNNPAPTLVGISPESAVLGSPGFTLVVSGTHFVDGAVVTWDGTPLPTSFTDDTQLLATVADVYIAAQGSISVTVVNPAPGGGTSNSIIFEVSSAEPPGSTIYLPIISDLLAN